MPVERSKNLLYRRAASSSSPWESDWDELESVSSAIPTSLTPSFSSSLLGSLRSVLRSSRLTFSWQLRQRGSLDSSTRLSPARQVQFLLWTERPEGPPRLSEGSRLFRSSLMVGRDETDWFRECECRDFF